MSETRINANEWVRRVLSREVDCLNRLPEGEKEEKYAIHLKVLQTNSGVFKIAMPETSKKLKQIDDLKARIKIAEEWMEKPEFALKLEKTQKDSDARYKTMLCQLSELEEGLIK